MYLAEIKRDDRFEGYLIVRSAEQRASANGKNYLDMTLADKTGSINAKMWDGTVQPPLAGSIVKVRATGNEFNGRMQLRVEKIRAAENRDPVDMSALIPCAPRDPNEMLGEVVRAADHIADPDLRRITQRLDDLYGASVSPISRRAGDYQASGFYVSLMDDRFALDGESVLEKTLDFVTELLFDYPTEDGGFLKDFVEGEKINQIAAIESELNDKRVYAAQKLLETLCGQDPYGVPKMGTRQEVEAITPQELLRHYEALRRESPVEVYYVGAADPGRHSK